MVIASDRRRENGPVPAFAVQRRIGQRPQLLGKGAANYFTLKKADSG
jgi:hypothetical protein